MNKLGKVLVFVFALSILLMNFYFSVEVIRLRTYFSLGLLLIAFLIKKLIEGKSPLLFDYILAITSIISFLYIFFRYPYIVETGGLLNTSDYIIGALALILIMYGGFKYNRNLFYLCIIFLIYTFLGKFFPSSISHSGFTIKRIIQHLIWGSQGIFGVAIGVAVTYIFLFLLFGEFLMKSGLSDFIHDLSLALIGSRPGGPAKVAVLASGLMGMINGSAVANVATTGTITIPLMKKIGYKKEFAAGVEAVSSTGGQFAPPIMGAVGFIMAEYLGIPYSEVMFAAIVPAFLFYFGIITSVHLEAKKLGLLGMDDKDVPDLRVILKERGYLALPLIIVVGLIVYGYSPLYSALVGIVSTILVSQFSKSNKLGIQDIFEAVVGGTMNTIGIGIACLNIGIIIGLVSLTALGLNFGNLVMSITGSNSLLLAGFLTMLMSIILGMGVPGVAAYVIVTSVSVPVLIKMGALPIVAHMFCLIYACLSNITPPVAISSYVAAGIAGANESKTSIEAIKLGISGFILPFFFLVNPVLLIGAVDGVSVFVISRVIITATIGIFSISAALSGILYNRLSLIERIILFLNGLMVIDTRSSTDIIGLVILVLVIIYNRRKNEKN